MHRLILLLQNFLTVQKCSAEFHILNFSEYLSEIFSHVSADYIQINSKKGCCVQLDLATNYTCMFSPDSELRFRIDFKQIQPSSVDTQKSS